MTQLSLAFQNLVYGCGCFCTILFVAVLPSSFVVTVHGHGLLTHPPSKNGGTLSIPDEGSTTHFARASYGIIDKAFFHQDHSKTPWTRPGDFDHHLAADLIAGHPETLHPCGCNAAVNIGECAGVVHASGFGERLYDLDDIEPVSWSQGSIQETAWNAWANHAGGDIFMLCSKQDFDACRDTLLPNPPRDATEDQTMEYLTCVWDCFESHTLEWAEEDDESSDWSQKIQYEDEDCTYATMTPQVKVGKDGNLHRYTPIPDSLQVTNGGEGMCMWDSVTSFSNQRAYSEFLSSFGDTDTCDWGPDSHTPYQWHVFDKVVVPTDIQTGEYLLSWRWDGYMADQMWTNCADVRIVDQNDASGQSVFGSDGCPTMPPTPVVDSSPPPTPSPLPPPTQAPTTPSGLNCPVGHTGLLPYDLCIRYYQCTNGQVVGELLTCPNGSLFDVDIQACSWDFDFVCNNDDDPTPAPTAPTPPPTRSTPPPTSSTDLYCDYGYTGMRPHDSCTKYYHCYNGELRGAGVTPCPAGTLFDMEVQYCNWSHLVDCTISQEGCYSNNYKDCNHPHFQEEKENHSCTTIWLPFGRRNTCVALWGDCTEEGDECCLPAICYKGDDNDDSSNKRGQCIVPPPKAPRVNA